jgi:hypothetical protein
VVTRWTWPDAFDGVSVSDLRAAQARVAAGRWRRYASNSWPPGISYGARLGKENIKDDIRKRFRQDFGYSASLLAQLSPALGAEARALSDAEEADCCARVDEVFADCIAAEEASSAASDTEDAAMMAICSYRCASLEEAATKASYLATIKDDLPEEAFAALLDSFLPLNA